MFIIELLRYFLGYVTISIKGEFPEKILNIFLIKKVSVWDIKKYKNSIILNISIRDFKRMPSLRGATGLRVKILEKHGIIFILRKYVKRIGIPVGISVFLLTLYVLSLFIWNIEVVGNSSVPTANIIKKCEDLGVKNGTLVSKINSQLLREKLILSCDGISWCSFNIEGSKLTVNISEISKNSNENIPSNIVSEFDGIISEIFVESGVALVKKGQAVQKGDILISGITEGVGGNKFSKARGVVKAEIIETLFVEEQFFGERLEESGEIKEKSVLEVFGIKIPLFLGTTKPPFNEELSVQNLLFFGEKMPILLFKKTFYLKENVYFNYSREELLQILNKKMENKLNEISSNITVLNRNIFEFDNKLRLTYEIRYTINVGKEEKIIFNVPK